MNKEEVISEGYLAAYITEELSVSELQLVEQFINTDADIKGEFIDLQQTIENLAFEYGISPSNVVKRFIMEDPKVFGSAHIAGGARKESNFTKLLMAASIIIALGSAFTAFYFWSAWKSSDERLTALTIKNIQMAENYNIVNQELSNIREDLAVIISPEFSRIILNGTDNAPDAKAVIYWDKEHEEVYLNTATLAQLPSNQQYQLWALIDGNPVDAGVFDATDGTFQIMKSIASADAFAVTIENAGGSESPTLETMQVYGTI